MPRTDLPSESISRRKFIAYSGIAPAIMLGAFAGGRALAAVDSEAGPETFPKRNGRRPIGLELYSVRKELARDLPGTLRKVAGMGYEVVEFYAPYHKWSIPYAKDVRSLMDDVGLRCHSTHNPIEAFTSGEGMAKAIELNQILGTKYLILASTPKGMTTVEDWKVFSGKMSAVVPQLSPHGLAAGVHNHLTEWASLGGGPRVMDVIADNTPEEFVLQLDVGTCMEAGADPIAWIKSHPGRIRSVHLKDWAPGNAADEKGFRVLFGEGISPWREIVTALESVGGVEFYLLEQEGSRFSEFETAQRNLDAWKKFRHGA